MPNANEEIPPQRFPSWVRRVALFAAFLCFVLGGIVFGIYISYLGRTGVGEDGVHVVIASGLGRGAISERLNEAGIKHPEWVMMIEAIRRGGDYVPKAGEYALPRGSSLSDAMDILDAGVSIQHSFTMPEGQTVAEVIERIYDDDRLEGLIAPLPEEGSLLPETYFFARGAERNALILRMQSSQELVFAELWSERVEGLPFETLDEAIILASIVEKETGKDSERGLVASVFVNRLRRGMKLQSDPTTLYGLERSGLDVSVLLREHLSHDSAWNTYRYGGLPATAISNPGVASLRAVLHPEASVFLYFVADGAGGHRFAETLEEHNANVRLWREARE